jgi:hypothetical protein
MTRYLETWYNPIKKRLCSVRLCLTWNFIKWSIENKIDFVNSLAQPTK